MSHVAFEARFGLQFALTSAFPTSLLLLFVVFEISTPGFSFVFWGATYLDPEAASPASWYLEPDPVTTTTSFAAFSGFCKRDVVIVSPSHSPSTDPDDRILQFLIFCAQRRDGDDHRYTPLYRRCCTVPVVGTKANDKGSATRDISSRKAYCNDGILTYSSCRMVRTRSWC